MKSTRQNAAKIVVLGMILTIAFLFWGCALHLADSGKNQFSSGAREIFESFLVLPNANYFYIGSNISPDAIIAVDKNYTVTSSGIWIKVEPEPKDLKYWVETMQRNIGLSPDGYKMFDPKGNLIGFYYSRWDPWPVRMEGENKVWIYPPDKNESMSFQRGL